jgi:predicted nucleic-acid-binding protein
MIGLDTNVLVRYIAQDDVVHSAKATQLIESLSIENQGFITLLSMMELVWVMQGCYQAIKEECIAMHRHTFMYRRNFIRKCRSDYNGNTSLQGIKCRLRRLFD